MIRRHWLAGPAAIALLATFAAGRSPAQDTRATNLTLEESQVWDVLREGKKAVGEPEKAVLRKLARIQVNRMLEATAAGYGSSDSKPVTDVVRRLAEVIIDPLKLPRPVNVNEFDVINVFGQELSAQLMQLIGTPEKPARKDNLIQVNAARMLSFLARSGYEGVGTDAVTIINDPNQHDAVKFWALEALRNLFTVPHREKGPEFSVFTKPEAEVQAIQALTNFIARKPAVDASTPKDELDAYRYVRRAAVRALGQVRKPIVKVDDKIVAQPALWLLRVANADTNLVPSPSLSERVDGLAGYLQLNIDKDIDMTFTVGFVATAMRDLAAEYTTHKPPGKPKLDEKKLPTNPVEERDTLAWRESIYRLSAALQSWRKSWDELPAANKPAAVQRMLNRVVETSEKEFLKPAKEGRPNEEITLVDTLEKTFLNTEKFNTFLLPDDKNSFITRP